MIKHLAVASLLACASLVAQAEYPSIGRAATPAEISAWDIDVRPDFKGLPPGAGSVSAGETVWTAKCASCHGDFGDANHVFAPLVGNTTAEDIKTGHVASLKAGGSVRTTFTKLATVSTLWDFINRAMPWNAPKSLGTDEVYAVVAYLLNLAEVVPADYVLSDKNIAEVQARMPNRNGMTRDHGLWDIHGKPDTHNVACMKNCKTEVAVLSELPAFARNSHGDLAQQNRTYGPVRGVETAAASTSSAPPAADAAPAGPKPADVVALMTRNGCTGCHGMAQKIVGPGFAEVAARYQGKSDGAAHLSKKIREGGAGVWGAVPMPPQAALSDGDIKTLVDWLMAGAKAP